MEIYSTWLLVQKSNYNTYKLSDVVTVKLHISWQVWLGQLSDLLGSCNLFVSTQGENNLKHQYSFCVSLAQQRKTNFPLIQQLGLNLSLGQHWAS